MQLNKFTDYALRILLHLTAAEGNLLTTKDISDIHNARYNHLAKVTQWLAAENYIDTQRGRSGGMRLAISADKINIGELIRKLEDQSVLVECMQADGGSCKLAGSCGLSLALDRARTAFFSVLDEYSLADLIVMHPKMRETLLGIQPARLN